MNSRAKGKRGELEWRDKLREMGYTDARRGQQFAGGPDSPDVVNGIPSTHVEVKRVEKLRFWEALEQAKRDAGDSVPYVATRANGRPWAVVLEAEYLEQFARCVLGMKPGATIEVRRINE